MSYTSRLAYLLGEMRREKNGAVADFMRFYGADYGLNYGVSIPTIRSISKSICGDDSAVEHKFARKLYRQEVRELRLAALWFADSGSVSNELDLWAAGIINSEVAEEAAFALLGRCSGVEQWLLEESELLHYAAVLSFAQSDAKLSIESHAAELQNLLKIECNLLPKAVIALLDTALKQGHHATVELFLQGLIEDSPAAKYICEEMAWRLELAG